MRNGAVKDATETETGTPGHWPVTALVFVAVTAILIAPFAHRLLHQVHATSR